MSHKNKKGFTLVEVVIAMALLAIVVAVFSNLIFTGLKNRDLNREKLEVIAFTTSTLEEIKSLQDTWKDIAGLKTWLLSKGFVTTEQDVYTQTPTDSNGIKYETKVTINKNINITGLFEITVSVESPNVKQIKISTRLRGA